MDPFMMAMMGIGGNLAGNFLANDFNTQNIQQQEQYQTQMSDTQMQRRMADLKAAGLNPILAAGSLGGASAPSGGAAQMSAPDLGDSAVKAMSSAQQINQSEAQTNQLEASTRNTDADTIIKGKNANILSADEARAKIDASFFNSSAGSVARRYGLGAQEFSKGGYNPIGIGGGVIAGLGSTFEKFPERPWPDSIGSPTGKGVKANRDRSWTDRAIEAAPNVYWGQ